LSKFFRFCSDKLLDQDSGGTEGRALKVMKSKTAVTVRLLDFMEAMKAEKILASARILTRYSV
jgi:hypothetical protein